MGYLIDTNAKNVWVRDHADTEDLSVIPNANSVYFNNGRTMEQEFGKGTMSSNIATIDSGMKKVTDGTYDGAYESCKMYGKSLVNLFNSKQITPSLHFSSNNDGKYENIVKSNGLIEFDIVGSENPRNYQYINMGKVNVDLLKPNTRYLVLFEEITGIDTVSIRDGNSANTVIDYAKVGGKQYVILTTLSEWQKSNQILYLYVQSKTGIHVKVKNAMIIEYQEGMEQWDLDYFEGLCDVKAPILKNVGKNLFDMTKVETDHNTTEYHWDTTITQDTIKSVRKRDNVNGQFGAFLSLKVKPSTTYTIQRESYKNNQRVINGIYIYVYHNSLIWGYSIMGSSKDSFSFTTRPDTDHITIGVNYGVYEIGTILETKNIQLEEVNVQTLYEDHKTNILETSNDVVLRGLPNGAKDSYDCLTGEYVQRVSGITLDGTQSVSMDGTLAYIHITDLVENNVSMSDVLPSVRVNDVLEGIEGVAVQNRGNNSRIYININGLATAEEITQRLQQKPVTIQYQLAEPIVTTIEPSTTPFAYENGHIILESGHEGQSLLPTLEYQTVVSRSGQVAMIDKTIQQHERKIALLEKMLVQNIIDIEYKNTLLALKLEINEVI